MFVNDQHLLDDHPSFRGKPSAARKYDLGGTSPRKVSISFESNEGDEELSVKHWYGTALKDFQKVTTVLRGRPASRVRSMHCCLPAIDRGGHTLRGRGLGTESSEKAPTVLLYVQSYSEASCTRSFFASAQPHRLLDTMTNELQDGSSSRGFRRRSKPYRQARRGRPRQARRYSLQTSKRKRSSVVSTCVSGAASSNPLQSFSSSP